MFKSSLIFSLSITGPICLLLFLGWFLKKISIINDDFIKTASGLVFKVTLPALLFLSIVKTSHASQINFNYIAYMLLANFLFFILVTVLTKVVIKAKHDHGVIIQGGFRANAGIIGLAYVVNVYGDAGIALAAIYVAFNSVLYNILAVITLTPGHGKISTTALFSIFSSISKNPLIIAIILGGVVFVLDFHIPIIMIDAGQYFADMTLPMALLCIGGSLNLQSLNSDVFNTVFSALLKLVLAPLLITGMTYYLGFRGMELGITFLMTAAPTAAASYVMASSMGGNVNLAANIIAMTTLGSLLSCSVGIAILYHFQLI